MIFTIMIAIIIVDLLIHDTAWMVIFQGVLIFVGPVQTMKASLKISVH